MKKNLLKKGMVVITLVAGLLVMVACGGSGGASGVDKVTAGMTVKEMEKAAGKATKEIKVTSDATGQEEAEKIFTDDMTNLTAVASSDSKKLIDFYGDKGEEELTKMMTEISSAGEMTIYQYEYTNSDKEEVTRNFYVVSDKVILSNFK